MKNILVIGDVVGRCGREILSDKLNEIKTEYNIDFTVVNGENATTGNGINEKYAKHQLFSTFDQKTFPKQK